MQNKLCTTQPSTLRTTVNFTIWTSNERQLAVANPMDIVLMWRNYRNKNDCSRLIWIQLTRLSASWWNIIIIVVRVERMLRTSLNCLSISSFCLWNTPEYVINLTLLLVKILRTSVYLDSPQKPRNTWKTSRVMYSGSCNGIIIVRKTIWPSEQYERIDERSYKHNLRVMELIFFVHSRLGLTCCVKIDA